MYNINKNNNINKRLKSFFSLLFVKILSYLIIGFISLSALIFTLPERSLSEDDFPTEWTLAMNPDKPVYRPGETAHITMALLDKEGMMICDADMQLTVRSVSTDSTIIDRSTEDKTIIVNPACKLKKYTEEPDFETTVVFPQEGQYELVLSALEQSITIHEVIAVKENIAFDIRRQSNTRIYPMADYPMTIELTAKEDFKGVVEERLPGSYRITEFPQSSHVEDLGNGTKRFKMKLNFDDNILSEEGYKVLRFPVDLKAGETVKLTYRYKAPTLSPYLFKLQPLQIVKQANGPIVYQEPRQWQMAIDPSTTLRPDADGTTTGWTFAGTNNTTTAWDNINEDPNASDFDGTYIQGPNATDTNNTLWVSLQDTPDDFLKTTNGEVEIVATHGENGSANDTIALEYQIVTGNGSSTGVTAETTFGLVTDNTVYETDTHSELAVTGTDSKASFDAAYLRIRAEREINPIIK